MSAKDDIFVPLWTPIREELSRQRLDQLLMLEQNFNAMRDNCGVPDNETIPHFCGRLMEENENLRVVCLQKQKEFDKLEKQLRWTKTELKRYRQIQEYRKTKKELEALSKYQGKEKDKNGN